jgi:hypothetical protein
VRRVSAWGADVMDKEWVQEHRIFIALCEAGWRGSPCWHVVDWMQWRLRLKYPLVDRRYVVFDPDWRGT